MLIHCTAVRQHKGVGYEAPEDAVIEALEAYVEFATKCKNKGSNPR